VRQRLGESLCSFIQWFSQVRNTIPRIFNASVVVTFHQGVRDEKMLKKLTTHDIQDVAELFSLVDKCDRAVPDMPSLLQKWGRVPSLKRALLPQGSGSKNKKKKKKKASGSNQPLAGAPTAVVAATAAGGG
jgi:hypothetical protein